MYDSQVLKVIDVSAAGCKLEIVFSIRVEKIAFIISSHLCTIILTIAVQEPQTLNEMRESRFILDEWTSTKAGIYYLSFKTVLSQLCMCSYNVGA